MQRCKEMYSLPSENLISPICVNCEHNVLKRVLGRVNEIIKDPFVHVKTPRSLKNASCVVITGRVCN